jgi:CheY-like chemotaxis protein
MHRGREVLIVDDDAGMRRMVSLVLAGEGYEVRTAENGLVALDLLASWQPAIILLDLMMPVMDGWTFLAAQQADPVLARIPVIVLSASGDPEAIGPDHGAAAILTKPFRVAQVLEKVAALVG